MSGTTPSVVTLTPAPVLDRTYFVSNLVPGGVNRADAVGEELAGKGINVSRGLVLGGISSPAVVPIGASAVVANPALGRLSGNTSIKGYNWSIKETELTVARPASARKCS